MDQRLFVAEENCKRLDVFLSDQTEDFTRSRLKKLVEEGQVCVNDAVVKKAGAEIKRGDRVTIQIPEAVEYSVKPENIPIDIVYEDGDFAVVNKAQGMTVHMGNGNESGTLVTALLYALDSLSGIGGVLRPGIVHRIDKDTTGLLVVAKNDKAHVSLAAQIAEKTCHRTYYALLEGNMKEDRGRVVTDIGRHPTERLKMAVLPEGKGKIAITDFEVVARFGVDFTLCKFDLQTGRTHQIRVQMAGISHPIYGDMRYGGPLAQKGKLALWAYSLSFLHPITKERLKFIAYPPETETPWKAFDLTKAVEIK